MASSNRLTDLGTGSTAGVPYLLCGRLFALSFLALFLEMLLIRWAPSVVRLVAYYANLMLLSSFLGLGLGAMFAGRKQNVFRWFPYLLVLSVVTLLLCRNAVLPGNDSELRFFASSSRALNYLVLLAIFASNTILFFPLGDQIGQVFGQIPTLRAYTWDLLGSLCGTVGFGLFSSTHFSPALGLAGVGVIFLAISERKDRVRSLIMFLTSLSAMWWSDPAGGIWSPYYYITVHDSDGTIPASTVVRGDLRSRMDPPIYVVSVNHDFYQMHGTIDLSRYTPKSAHAGLVQSLRDQYLLPYALAKGRHRALVMGAGGGMDVEAALLSGVDHVDAVDIDPQIIELSRSINASGCYDDPRVAVHVDDARAFLENAQPGYDLVAFGFLDSQALFSSMSNLRLDGFTYTVESIRTAFDLLGEGGTLSLSFAAGQEWIAHKLVRMVADGTKSPPIVFVDGPQIIICACKTTTARDYPLKYGRFIRQQFDPRDLAQVPVATDDWPFLYLSRQTIPRDYMIVMGSILAISLITILSLRRRRWGCPDFHFLFLGVGFLLLETKSISDCSLYFGSTWQVTMIVVAGVLLMVLAANFLAPAFRFSLLWYIPLIATLIALYVIPHQWVLSLGRAQRVAWAILIVPLPILFAGIIFSTTFRGASDAGALFGANLVGAVIGGCCEYLGMAIGNSALLFLVTGAYVGSFICQLVIADRPGSRPTSLAPAPKPAHRPKSYIDHT
jgi:Spermine/spermidine synthase domain